MESTSVGMSYDPSNTQDNQPSRNKVLVSVIRNDKEVSKRVINVTGTADLIEQTLSQQRDSAFHRLLKYNAEFNDYIDDDGDDEAMKHLDRYQIILKEADQNEAEPLNAGDDRRSGPLENGSQGQPDSAPRFDATGLLALINSKAPAVLAEYEASGTLSLTSRKRLVRIGVSNLVEQRGFYPSSADKVMLAKSMIAVFPSLMIKIQENEGFEHFYDPVSHCGFIEMKLRNLRRSLQDDQRRYRKRRRSSDGFAGEVP
ncbi:uncharacterized protein LOC134466064 [Engraulis encrasicolus]|uniref:uncharacterized protein LOC134466064 n=1 Tax=Engraulis encrasicolus TaxID=184585 RepID=UPI002FD71BEE